MCLLYYTFDLVTIFHFAIYKDCKDGLILSYNYNKIKWLHKHIVSKIHSLDFFSSQRRVVDREKIHW